jgi:polyhydroxyalkanoate synthesis regulator phasin
MADAADRGVAEAVRDAVERTLSAAGRPARAGSSALTVERAARLLDELARRGREARDDLARRGIGARDELTDRVESLERRLAALEDVLRSNSKARAED